MDDKEKIITALTGTHLIEDIQMSHYYGITDMQLKIDGQWVKVDWKKFIGQRIEGELVKKRKWTWLE